MNKWMRTLYLCLPVWPGTGIKTSYRHYTF